MRYIVPAVLLVVAVIHALPLTGVMGSAKLVSLYGIPVEEPNLEILLRHRAVLFGLLAALLAYSAFRPALHRLALIAGLVSVVSFIALAQSVGGYNTNLSTVVRADILALVLLVVGALVHAFLRSKAPYLGPAESTRVNNAGMDPAGRNDAGQA
jgi:hypothetical protein